MDFRPSTETVGMILDVSGVTMYALLAIWAAASRRYWFLRTCVVGAMLLIVLVIPAYDLLVQFLVVHLIVVSGVTLWRWRRHRRRIAGGAEADTSSFKPQLSLASIFLLTVVAAVVCAVAVRFKTFSFPEWLRLVLQGTVFSVSCLLCLWCVYVRRPRWYLRWLIVGVCGAGLATVLAFYRWALHMQSGSWQTAVLWWPFWAKSVGVGLIVLTLVLYAWRGSGWLQLWVDDVDVATSSNKRRNMTRAFFVVLLLLTTVPPIYVFVRLLVRPAIPTATLPDPNAYDRIIKTGNSVAIPTGLQLTRANANTLRTLLDAHRSVLDELRVALREPCVVPIDYRSKETSHIEKPVFALARLLYCEQRLAKLKGRDEDALTAFLDCARLTEHMTRGTTKSEWEAIISVITPLTARDEGLDLVNRLDAASCRRFVRELQQIDANREPLEQIQRRTYIRDAYGSDWGSRARQVVREIAGDTSEEEYFSQWHRVSALRLRQVMVAAAVKAYTLEHNALPDRLEDLVPEYLDAVPLDPFSSDSKPIRYEVTETGYRLTTVGVDSEPSIEKPIEITLEAGEPVWTPPTTDKE